MWCVSEVCVWVGVRLDSYSDVLPCNVIVYMSL